MNPRHRPRPRCRGLVENEEQGEDKKLKSIVEEQEQEEGSESESETGFVDLDQDTLHNVLKRVDVVTLGRAECVNKLWRKVARDEWLWEPFAIRYWAGHCLLGSIDELRKAICGRGCRWSVHSMILFYVAKPPPSDFLFDRTVGLLESDRTLGLE